MSGTDIQMDKGSDVEGTTMRLYRPVSELHAEHIQMFVKLQTAMFAGDMEAATAARIRIGEIEVEVRQKFLLINSHTVKKAASHG